MMGGMNQGMSAYAMNEMDEEMSRRRRPENDGTVPAAGQDQMGFQSPEEQLRRLFAKLFNK